MENNVIEIDIKTKDGVFNKFNDNQISDELGDYIFRNAKKTSIYSTLSIVIDNKAFFTKEEQEVLVDAIREYFGLLVREKINHNKYNGLKKIVLFMIGVLLILTSNLIRSSLGFLIPEVVSIAGCVAIWEVVNMLLFVDSKNSFETKKLRELTECEVIFLNNK